MTTTFADPFLLLHELRDFERFPIAPLLARAEPRLHRRCADIMARTREYADRHLAGRVERWDQEVGRDHRSVVWPAIDAGIGYGFLSMSLPAAFGGGGVGPLESCVFAEELAAADAGIYVVYGAHHLAVAVLLASLDTRAIGRLAREVLDGEKRGQPVLLALAHTEPGGGSDVEDVDEMRRARYASRFVRVPGGYRVHARKVFISNGSLARYNLVTASADLERPLETARGFLIRHDAPGFAVGRVEHKMGQRLSPAAEIMCDGVFVPDEDAIHLDDPGRAIDTTLSLTRGPIGAMSAGILRGVLERTLAYLSQKRVGGRWLFEEQWVQLRLAELVGALQSARGLYLDAALASEAWGISRVIQLAPMRALAALPSRRAVQAILTHRGAAALARGLYRDRVPKDQLQHVVGRASVAKFVCSDLAVRMCLTAMEILGEDASDPAWGVEKCLRDAKLGQIFEGTNQINRLHATRGLIQRRPRPDSEERTMPTSDPSRPRPVPLGQGIARAVWNLAKIERAEGTLLRTVRVAAARRGPAFARDWTFAELLEWAADRYADRPFLEHGSERISFGEANRRANRVARRLRAAGIAHGGIALMMSNHPRFLDAFFAVQKLGGYVVPVNTALVGDGLGYLLDHSEARAIICDHETAAKVQAVHGWVNADEAPNGWTVPAGMRDFAELERGTIADGDNLGIKPRENAPSLLLYTSGTTGLPKAVVTSYGGQRVKNLGLLANILYDRSDKLYTCLPLFHANALLLTIMTALWVGIPVVLRKRFSASQFWRDVAECGATQFNTVGGMIPILLKTPPSPWDRAHRVRRVLSAACPRDAWVPFEQRFGVTLWEGYGAVDGAGVTLFNAGNAPVGSLGRPPRAMKWRLVDDCGREVPKGQPGELWVYVGHRQESCVEYWRNQQASSEKVVDGWLHTGDLMHADQDGYLYFVGRNTDSMRRRGENVSAYEIEQAVDAHPDVLESAAFGVPSPFGEQDIMISVVPVDGRTIDPADLLRFLEERLPRYALPAYLDVVGELPKTATHRVIKSELMRRGVTATTVRLQEPPTARSKQCATPSS